MLAPTKEIIYWELGYTVHLTPLKTDRDETSSLSFRVYIIAGSKDEQPLYISNRFEDAVRATNKSNYAQPVAKGRLCGNGMFLIRPGENTIPMWRFFSLEDFERFSQVIHNIYEEAEGMGFKVSHEFIDEFKLPPSGEVELNADIYKPLTDVETKEIQESLRAAQIKEEADEKERRDRRNPRICSPEWYKGGSECFAINYERLRRRRESRAGGSKTGKGSGGEGKADTDPGQTDSGRVVLEMEQGAGNSDPDENHPDNDMPQS